MYTVVKEGTYTKSCVKRNLEPLMSVLSIFWNQKLHAQAAWLEKSWNLCKVPYEDGRVKAFHFSMRYNSIMTRARENHFRDVPFYCSYCYLRLGIICVENFMHIFVFLSSGLIISIMDLKGQLITFLT